jgi:hypothetical protein
VDNNHDGEVDEGYHVGNGCAFALGQCAFRPGEATDGLIACSDDHLHSVCLQNPDVTPKRGPVPEVAGNKIDDDCDGKTDEVTP